MANPAIRTPDQRLRVFVSSTLEELADERVAARRAIESLRLTPVMFELGARPHPARALYRAYVDQSHVFLGVYWQRYGWVAPGEEVSGLEDEYRLSGSLPRLVYLKDPAPEREVRLGALIDTIQSDDTVAYKRFASADELERLIAQDLAVLLSERFLETGAEAEPGSATWGVRLPEPPSAIVGRDDEFDDLCGALTDPQVRLVTLVGPGGIGKTRLGLELARAIATAFNDGAVMVPLQDARTDGEVLPGVAAAMGVTFDRDAQVGDALAGAIGDRRVLLYLDNFEHVLGAAPALSDLLERCANLTILVTSRSPLGLRAEHDVLVQPLSLPSPHDPDADRSGAVRLFVDRARSVSADFRLTDQNRDAVFDLCRRLEGIPLAIELAAARIRMLGPEALLERLDAHFELLVARAPDLPERQRTLRATVEWSYDLLNQDERRLFARLAVFHGGWTLEAAEGICGPDLDVLDALSGLVEHSLVTPSTMHVAVPRFRMFEIVRTFARDRLETSGETDDICDRHLDYFDNIGTDGELALRTAAHLVVMDQLSPEWENFRAAWTHALAVEQPGRAVGLAGCCFMVLWKLGRLREMQALIRSGLAQVDGLEPIAQARLWFAAAAVQYAAGQSPDAERYLDQFDAVRETANEPMFHGLALLYRSFLAAEQLDGDEVVRCLDASERVLREAGDVWNLCFVLSTRGSLASFVGDEDLAMRIHAEVLELSLQTGNDAMALQSFIAQAMSRLLRGDPTPARGHLREALPYFESYPYSESVPYAYEAGAALGVANRAPDTAARLLGAADMARRSNAAVLWPLLQPQRDAVAAEVEVALGADDFTRLSSEGARLGPLEATALLRGLLVE